MEVALLRKEEGNKLYEAGEYELALAMYGKAMLMIGACAEDERVCNNTLNVYHNTTIGNQVREVEVAVLLNSAICHLKTNVSLISNTSHNDDEEGGHGAREQRPEFKAIMALTRCLIIDPSNSKALLRRSQAHQRMDMLDKALADATRAKSIEDGRGGKLVTSCKNQLARLNQLARKQDQKDAKVFGKMIQGLGRDKSEKQSTSQTGNKPSVQRPRYKPQPDHTPQPKAHDSQSGIAKPPTQQVIKDNDEAKLADNENVEKVVTGAAIPEQLDGSSSNALQGALLRSRKAVECLREIAVEHGIDPSIAQVPETEMEVSDSNLGAADPFESNNSSVADEGRRETEEVKVIEAEKLERVEPAPVDRDRLSMEALKGALQRNARAIDRGERPLQRIGDDLTADRIEAKAVPADHESAAAVLAAGGWIYEPD